MKCTEAIFSHLSVSFQLSVFCFLPWTRTRCRKTIEWQLNTVAQFSWLDCIELFAVHDFFLSTLNLNSKQSLKLFKGLGCKNNCINHVDICFVVLMGIEIMMQDFIKLYLNLNVQIVDLRLLTWNSVVVN